MAFDFTEEDFAPKSKFDFSEEDFKPATPAVKRNVFGESKEDLEAKGAILRNEAISNKVGDVALNAASWLAYLTPMRESASRIMGIPQGIPERPALVDPETIRQSIQPLTEHLNMPWAEPVIQGATEFGAETASGLTKPSALETMATGPAAPLIFATEMAQQSPQALQQLKEAASTGDVKETTKAALNAGLAIAGPLGIAKAYEGKPVTEPVTQPTTGEALKTPEGTQPPTETVRTLMQEGVNRPDAEDLVSGKKTVREVVEGNFKKFITPAWNADVNQSRGGHGEAWVAGYNDATARLNHIVENGNLQGFIAPSVDIPPLETKTTQPKETDARTQQEAAKIYEPLLPQPLEGQGQVPVKEGEPRVQPQTEGRVSEKEVAPAQTLETAIRDPNVKANNQHSTEAGMAVKSVEDLEKLAQLREQLYKESREILAKSQKETDPAKRDDLFNQALILGNKVQLPREAIEVATNAGSWEEKPGQRELGERPMDWRNNPEVADWLDKNAKRIGTAFERPKEAAPTETVLAAQATPTHGLPTGVPDRGQTFPSELMEASRQLGALVRSRATLRPGVLGQFVKSKLAGIQQADKIEVGDVRNQNTVAHEIGHSLDGILWPKQNFGNSQASLAARVGTGTGKELSGELTKISELMRGPMTGSKGHIAYRKRASELIADFVSLYAHDPARAKSMAPKFAKGFEDALARDKNTQDVVQGIVSGNVVPKPPDPALKKQLAGITGTPPQPGTTIPNQVPAKQVLPPPVRERAAAVAGEGLVKDAVRTFAAKVEKTRIIADNWRKFVKDQSDRNDVGAFVEGIGNLEKPGDTIDRVRTRMTPEKERLAKDYRFRTELERQEINQHLKETEEGEYLKFLEDYLGHFYVDPKAKLQAAVGRFSKDSPHAKQRKLPTLKEAVNMGLTPITQDPANTYELTSRINWQVATNRKFVGKLKDITTGSGDPVVVPAKDAPAGWVVTNNPLIQRVYARQSPSGLMLWRGGAAIHPDVWRSARQILEQPISGDFGKAYDAINGFTRANAFAFSLFHDLTLRSAAIGSMAKVTNPLRGLFRLFEQHPITGEREIIRSTRGLGKELLQNEEAVADAAQHGLKFSYTDSEAYQHNARTFLERRAAAWRDVPVIGKSARLARDIQQWRQEGLWKNTHDAFKIITYHDLVSKALDKAPPGTDTAAVKEQISSFLNDAYGGQEWQTKFWLDPGTRKVLSRFFLAPDWTLSTIRSVPLLSDIASTVREQAPRIAGRESFPTPKEGLGNVRRARFWGAELAALATATAAAQYAIYQAFGDPKKGDKPFVWDNELNQKGRIDVTPIVRKFPWHDPKDPTRQYVNLGKRPAEIVNWVSDLDKQILSKASRPVAMIFEQVSGSEGDFKAPWKQDHEAFIESLPKRAVAIGKQALPFTFMGNQFALSVPVRKGMTKYKAQQAYESVFELATDPNRIKSLLRGQQPSEGTISQMTSQITDAAHRNGVPAEEVMKHALSTVRGHHYNEFFKAFEKGDRKKMHTEAKALVTLGATSRGIEESVKRRMGLQPVAPE